MYDKSFRADDFIDEILSKFSTSVFRMAYSQTKNKADAEDVLQDVFMRLIRSNTEFESEKHLEAWLIKVTINVSRNLLTSAWFRKTTGLEENVLADEPVTNEVYDTVLQLPVKYRTVIHLYYYENMSLREISKILGKKESTVKSQLHRAREILKNKLKGETPYVQGNLQEG